MNAHKRWEKERPFAASVDASAKHLAKTPTLPEVARVSALFAIAHAVLDLSDAIRELARKDER